MPRATLQDIANEAGICKATVSYVLNDNYKSKRISEKTAANIQAIAQRLGYHFDDVARAMSTGRSNAIGFISACGMNREYISGILAGAMERADKLQLSIKLLHSHWGMTGEEVFRECRRQRLRGLLCYDFDKETNEVIFARLAEEGMPLAIISNTDAPEGAIHVMADDRQGSRLAVEHLCRLGHARIAFMSSDNGKRYETDRRGGYLDSLKALGLEAPDGFFIATNERSARMEFIQRIRSMENGPTALICSSDEIAMAAVSYLHRLGEKVPEDISVVGYGALSVGGSMIPSLTTIEEPYAEIGEKAVEMICSPRGDGRKTLVPVRLLARESTRERGR